MDVIMGFLFGWERMRKWPVVVLILILILSGVAVYILTSIKPTPAKIGIFYYVWYGAPDSDNWNASKFVDFPVLGNYSSPDAAIIKSQLVLMRDLGIDFVVISWWGFGNNYANFIDGATRQVLETAELMVNEGNLGKLKFAIMVEPCLGNGSAYNYAEIYNRIYDNFVVPYSSIYYNYSDKPLIYFFNDPDNVPGLTPNGKVPVKDTRFSTIIVGQQNYADWTYNDLNINDTPSNVPHDREISVTPRYDDSRVRYPNCTIDADLTNGTYDIEWKNAIKNWTEGKIDTIMITSWNEYPERTAIEPHHDATAYNQDPYFLYNTTKNYINQFRQLIK